MMPKTTVAPIIIVILADDRMVRLRVSDFNDDTAKRTLVIMISRYGLRCATIHPSMS